MPDATVRANAQAMPIDRRLFLATGAASAVLSALHAASAPLALKRLMLEHWRAWRAFEAVSLIEDGLPLCDPRRPAVHAEWIRLSDLEFAALNALCAFRPTTMQEVQARGDYLADFLIGAELGPDQLEALLESFRSPEARPRAAFRRYV